MNIHPAIIALLSLLIYSIIDTKVRNRQLHKQILTIHSKLKRIPVDAPAAIADDPDSGKKSDEQILKLIEARIDDLNLKRLQTIEAHE